MAQDFRAAFGLQNDDDKTISTADPAGVVLAAIQGFNVRRGVGVVQSWIATLCWLLVSLPLCHGSFGQRSGCRDRSHADFPLGGLEGAPAP